MGYAPVEIKPVSLNLKREITIPGVTDRVSLKDVALMSRQLATMVAAGLTLVRALGVLADQIESKPLREAMLQVRQEVEQGSSLSTSLEKLPKVFPPLYIAMVRAGEVGGQLDSVLLKLSTHARKAGRAAPEGAISHGLPGHRVLCRHRDRDSDDDLHRPDLQEVVHLP